MPPSKTKQEISVKTRVQNALHRAMQEVQHGLVNDALSAKDKQILKVIDRHIDHAALKAYELARVDDDLEDFDVCTGCGTFVHNGPCVSEDPIEVNYPEFPKAHA